MFWLKLKCKPLAFISFRASFLKKKKRDRSGISLPTSFSAQFLKKNISHVMFF